MHKINNGTFGVSKALGKCILVGLISYFCGRHALFFYQLTENDRDDVGDGSSDRRK